LRGAAGVVCFVEKMSGITLPERCGVMILPDCTLFPHGGLPLFIFEPRYRQMLEESLEGDCFFAVGRRLAAQGDPSRELAAPVGTIGLVRASREQHDGTSQLLLHGVMRVRFEEWHDGKPYPYATIQPLPMSFSPQNQAVAAMKTLRGAVEDAIRTLPQEVRDGVLMLIDRAEEPCLMTDIVSQQFVHDPDLRQCLLETDSAGERIALLCAFLRQVAADA
jgi:Lon protease-like protein